MNIVVYGASGMIGQRITQEALNRGHKVTAVVRNPSRLTLTHPNLTVEKGNMLDPNDVARVAAGHDAVINATRQPVNEPGQSYSDAARALIEGLTRAGVRRLIVVGGAGSLEVAPGLQLVDTPDFPPAWKPGALAMRDALDIYRSADLDWTYFSPAGFISPGERTGKYRTGTEQLVTDEKGESRISAEDYAAALVDELENPRFVRRRFTAAY
ncbi:MAG TPA: NAD(P)-dependent oxidoreductase [Ktedonobacteraceae bacterium]|jgi:putative NADH-flavin reductase|nr:NAD(P)-dependent oxidoreductase [Ktedonobacteraceae bacterium]